MSAFQSRVAAFATKCAQKGIRFGRPDKGVPTPTPAPAAVEFERVTFPEYFWAQTVKQAFAVDLGDFNLKPIKAARQVKIVSGRRTRTKSSPSKSRTPSPSKKTSTLLPAQDCSKEKVDSLGRSTLAH